MGDDDDIPRKTVCEMETPLYLYPPYKRVAYYGNPVWFEGWVGGYCGRRLRPQLNLIFRLNVWFDFYISIFCYLCIC